MGITCVGHGGTWADAAPEDEWDVARRIASDGFMVATFGGLDLEKER
jgi:hypothetical protein